MNLSRNLDVPGKYGGPNFIQNPNLNLKKIRYLLLHHLLIHLLLLRWISTIQIQKMTPSHLHPHHQIPLHLQQMIMWRS